MVSNSNNPSNKANPRYKGNFIDILELIKNNLTTLIIIAAVIFILSVTYALVLPDIYSSSTVVRVDMPKGSILESPLAPLSVSSFTSDKYMAIEMETINNSSLIYEEAAKSVIDSINAIGKKGDFYLSIEEESRNLDKQVVLPAKVMEMIVRENTEVKQIENLTFLKFTASSQSPYEAALFANCFAKAYKDFNLLESRRQVTMTKEILGTQKDSMLLKLRETEDRIKEYQLAGGVIELDKTAQALIERLSHFETDKNTAKVEMSVSKEKLAQYKRELERKDPTILDYLESKSTEPYLKLLQEQIAKLQVQRDLAINQGSNSNSPQVFEFDKKINELKDQQRRSQQEYLSMGLTSSPEEVKELSGKIFEEEVKYQSLSSSYNELSKVINSYEGRFNQLPARTIGFARLERERSAFEKLYLVLEQKYQEALINEQSIPGNVQIMSAAGIPGAPSKPNRKMIMILGLILGGGIAFGFIYMKSYFDRTIKTPEDIEANHLNVLAWIPKFSSKDILGLKNPELIVAQKPDSIPSESFRTIRTRLQFSQISKGSKTILITSSAPGEGKTTVSINLAASFAQANKKVVVVDCDLRKPRLHTLIDGDETEGFLNYLFGQAQYEKIIKKSEVRNLDFITAGSIPSNPSEILGSPAMKSFIEKLRNDYEIIILDSPPVMAVSDAEILARFVDVCLLVVSANTSEIDWLRESADLLKQENINFAGVLLNNFNYRSSYHSYYRYYDHYSENYKESKKKDLVK